MRLEGYQRRLFHAGSLLFERLSELVAAGDLSTYAKGGEARPSRTTTSLSADGHKAIVVLAFTLLIAVVAGARRS